MSNWCSVRMRYGYVKLKPLRMFIQAFYKVFFSYFCERNEQTAQHLS